VLEGDAAVSKKTTPWFNVRSHPIRVGVYEIADGSWSYFDGRHWNGAWSTPEKAVSYCDWYATNKSEGAIFSSDKWRGLAADPKRNMEVDRHEDDTDSWW